MYTDDLLIICYMYIMLSSTISIAVSSHDILHLNYWRWLYMKSISNLMFNNSINIEYINYPDLIFFKLAYFEHIGIYTLLLKWSLTKTESYTYLPLSVLLLSEVICSFVTILKLIWVVDWIWFSTTKFLHLYS